MAHSKMAMITFFEAGEPVDPSYGVPGLGGGNYPSQGLPRPGGPVDPGYGHGGGGGHITTLPVFPFDPTRPDQGLPGDQPGVDNTLPGGGGSIDNSLPRPGKKYVVKWLACYGLILVPDNSLPQTPEPK